MHMTKGIIRNLVRKVTPAETNEKRLKKLVKGECCTNWAWSGAM